MTLGRKLGAGAVVLALGGFVAFAATFTPVNERRTGTAAGPQLTGSLVGAGSSAQQAAMQGWTAGFSALQPGVSVDYDPVGSGGGREQFLAGGIAFAGSDAALDDAELAEATGRCGPAGVFELPDYIAPIAVVHSLDVPDLQLSPTTLAGLFSGAITRWDDPAVAADNPGVVLPDLAVAPVHRSDDSGTTENFTDYLVAAAGDAWPAEASGEWPLDGGEAAQGNSGVVAAVRGGVGTVGYADLSQAGDLGVASIGVGETFVAPSAETAAAVVEESELLPGRGEHDRAIELARDTTTGDQYPIVLVSYHVGCLAYDDADTVELLQAFLSYVVSEEGQEAAAEVAGSAPISDALREEAEAAIAAIHATT